MRLRLILFHLSIKIQILGILLLIGSIISGARADSIFEDCLSRTCGSGPNISYPFYVESAGADHCGLQGFNIDCEQNTPLYRTSKGSYIVEDISYEKQWFRLVDPNVANNATCIAPKYTFSFGESSSFYHLTHANLQFLYGCNKSFAPRFETSTLPCASNTTHLSFVALVPNDYGELSRNFDELVPYCESSDSLPVDLEGYWEFSQNQTIKTVSYIELSKNGFTLVWYGNTSCAECKTSGGRCGFQNNTSICFCPDGHHSTQHCKSSGKSSTNLIIAAAGVTTVAGIGILSAMFCFLRKKLSSSIAFVLFWKKQSQTYQNVEAFLRNYGPLQVRRYSYSDIKKMTNSFTEKLGQGGFGDVYKGKLDDGCLVAVKVLNQSKGEDGQEFINEVATISRTSHVNVVTLLGFCFEGARRALIYEFMPNGSLEKFIFDEDATENSFLLDWETNYQISLGIAKGLEYLHRGCNTRILHFDIKPHNILLDADFVPKISDFGLAKICTRKESMVSMLGPRGTVGYIAPEVFSRNFGGVSHKSDVYSYGMMVLEMVGGRKNINVRVDNTSEIYFPHWIYKRLELDEELGLKRVTNEEDRIKVRKMIIVSLWCIQTDPSNRPAISKVIEMLEGSLDSLDVPPKPFLSSPSRSPPAEFSSTWLA
ncbi:Serine/threonine protein kinase [Trema orientale]|uniref:non-specific serine/threonine protein kinase n=1 Tax=Trema orientale TaxID=63057 RepID=A0A2P5EMZ8_TREOI|nr:Serine/threonine protein kinase [Trema orientale]